MMLFSSMLLWNRKYTLSPNPQFYTLQCPSMWPESRPCPTPVQLQWPWDRSQNIEKRLLSLMKKGKPGWSIRYYAIELRRMASPPWTYTPLVSASSHSRKISMPEEGRCEPGELAHTVSGKEEPWQGLSHDKDMTRHTSCQSRK